MWAIDNFGGIASVKREKPRKGCGERRKIKSVTYHDDAAA